MAQRSITAFFSRATRSVDSSVAESSDSPASGSTDSLVAESQDALSPLKKGKGRKRHRIYSSDSEPPSPKKPTETQSKKPTETQSKRPTETQSEEATETQSKKSIERQSIVKFEPSGNGEATQGGAGKSSKVDKSIKSEKSPKAGKLLKTEKSPKANKSPKVDKSLKSLSATVAVKCEVTPLTEKDTNVDWDSDRSPTTNTDVGNSKKLLGKITPSSYEPGKLKYNPITDACWSRNEPVPYLALARTLETIEATSARTRIVQILSNYLRSVMVLTPDDLLPSIYLCLNRLAPAYHSLELGVAETYLMKAIAQSTGRTLVQVKAEAGRVGDLGLVAEQSRSTQRVMFQPPPLTLRRVFTALKDIAALTGQSSMNKKVGKIQSLFVACRESEARYLIRSLAGKLRVGLAEQSVLQALALAATTTPPTQTYPPAIVDASKGIHSDTFKARVEEQALIVKTTYCECPNYELVLPVLLQHGVAALPAHCRLTPGVPLKPMLAHPTRGVREVLQRFENVDFTCEWKYDGERAQIHVPTGADGCANLAGASIFSRNQEDNTSKYPDVIARLGGTLRHDVHSCVLDCEVVAWDKQDGRILPFQVLSTRKRKDAALEEIKVQVCVFMFDLLYLNGRALVREPLANRRQLLRQHFNTVPGEWLPAVSRDCSRLEEVQEFLEEAVQGSCEGLMVKTLDGDHATYEIAKRSRNWLKLKKDYLEGVGDTVDACVVGAYLGRGKRTGVFGGFLLACYDPQTEQYQTLCKIGTGFSDEDLQQHSEVLEQYRIHSPPAYYRYDSSLAPDVWLSPGAVWEVRCADLSLSPVHRAAIGLVDAEKGISLRFPRFVRVREDKGAEDATSAQQVADLYLAQDQVRNQPAPAVHDDDFY